MDTTTTWFDYFPIEIIFIIFDYLSSNDIIYTFFFFNQQFNNLLLENQRYLNYLELPTKNLNKWKNILSIIRSQVKSLNLTSTDLSFPLEYFPNIKSLIISSPLNYISDDLISIIKSKQFPNLQSFQIKKHNYFYPEYEGFLDFEAPDILEEIFSRENSLKLFHCSLMTQPTLTNSFKININLHSLTIKLNTFQHFPPVLLYTPNLEYLNVHTYPFDRDISTHLLNRSIPKLKQFYLKLGFHDRSEVSRSIGYSLTINDIFLVIQQLSPSINCLSIDLVDIASGKAYLSPFTSATLQQLLESLVELKQFYFYTQIRYCQIESFLSEFKNQYWFDHNWFFGTHHGYFYTLPFHFDNLYYFPDNFDDIKMTNHDILINNSQLWYNAKSIELISECQYNKNFIQQLRTKMPKLNSIRFDTSKSKRLNLDSAQTKEIGLTLDNITTIGTYCESIENEIEWIINTLPNLNSLILSDVKEYSIENSIGEIFKKNIQYLHIDLYDNNEFMEINSIYFSNVQYMKIFWSNCGRKQEKTVKIIAKKTFTKFPNLKQLMIGRTDRRYPYDRCTMNIFHEYKHNDYTEQIYKFDYPDGHFLFIKKLLET